MIPYALEFFLPLLTTLHYRVTFKSTGAVHFILTYFLSISRKEVRWLYSNPPRCIEWLEAHSQTSHSKTCRLNGYTPPNQYLGAYRNLKIGIPATYKFGDESSVKTQRTFLNMNSPTLDPVHECCVRMLLKIRKAHTENSSALTRSNKYPSYTRDILMPAVCQPSLPRKYYQAN